MYKGHADGFDVPPAELRRSKPFARQSGSLGRVELHGQQQNEPAFVSHQEGAGFQLIPFEMYDLGLRQRRLQILSSNGPGLY
jgi:hypothetical protein